MHETSGPVNSNSFAGTRVSLAEDVRLGRFPLCIERVEVLVESFIRRLPCVYRASDGLGGGHNVTGGCHASSRLAAQAEKREAVPRRSGSLPNGGTQGTVDLATVLEAVLPNAHEDIFSPVASHQFGAGHPRRCPLCGRAPSGGIIDAICEFRTSFRSFQSALERSRLSSLVKSSA